MFSDCEAGESDRYASQFLSGRAIDGKTEGRPDRTTANSHQQAEVVAGEVSGKLI